MFAESGYAKVGFEQPADVYVINTCSVTENAEKECRQIIRKLKRQSPDAKVAVVGCYAQLQPEQIAAIPGVSLVLGAAEKFNIVGHLENAAETEGAAEVHATAIDAVDFYVDAHSFGDRTRTFLKVQDGCDYGCAFCTIPLARGKSRSAAVSDIVAQAHEIAQSGVKEIVLTGVNIGDFGKGGNIHPSEATPAAKGKNESLLTLIQALDEVESIQRFRISSIEPNLLSGEIIEFVAKSKRFAPHFHIPLQSGSNNILKKMRRRYLRELYAERVGAIKKAMPHCCIGVDVIVGFPGETHEDFLDTYKFLNELDISYLHVFTYSERPDTVAIGMPDAVPVHERKRRNNMLRSLSVKKRRFFYEQHVGETRPVLWESESNSSFLHGFTDNYIKVKIPHDSNLVNQMTHVALEKIDPDGDMLGKYIQFPVFSLQSNERDDFLAQLKTVTPKL